MGGDIAEGAENVSVSSGSLASGEAIAGIDLLAAPNGSGGGTITPSNAVIVAGVDETTSNYNITYAAGAIELEKEDSTAPILADVESEYTGEAFAIEIESMGDGGTINFSSSTTSASAGFSAWTTTIPTRIAIGTTWVKAKIVGDSLHNDSTESEVKTITITKREGVIAYNENYIVKESNEEPFTNELTNTGDGAVAYESSYPSVATINASTGLVTIVGIGTTTITATVSDGSIYTYPNRYATYTLEVVAPLPAPVQRPKLTVDVTGAITETSLSSHSCLDHAIDVYDDSSHWKECRICGKLYREAGCPDDSASWTINDSSIATRTDGTRVLIITGSMGPHNYTSDIWTYGSASRCEKDNHHVFACNCGYSMINDAGKANHTLQSNWSVNSSYVHYHLCTVCQKGPDAAQCTKNGVPINCGNIAKCDVCQTNWPAGSNKHNSVFADTGNQYLSTSGARKCLYCSINLESDVSNEIQVISEGHIKQISTYTLPAGATFSTYTMVTAGTVASVMNVTSSYTVDGNIVTITADAQYTTHVESPILLPLSVTYTLPSGYYTPSSGSYVSTVSSPTGLQIMPEYEAPTIASAQQIASSSLVGWTTQSSISVSGTENYCSTVTISLIDEDDNVLYTVTKNVDPTTHEYSALFTPELPSSNTPKDFIVKVSDALGNTDEVMITVGKMDLEPPEIIENSVDAEGVYSTGIAWSKSKDFNISAQDYGIDVATTRIQDVRSTKTGITYTDDFGYTTKNTGTTPVTWTREYAFTGDVKGFVTIKISTKDKLSNEGVKYMRIYNLDNTDPQIVVGNTSTSSVTATLSDSGSGIKYFAIIPKTGAFSNSMYPTTYQTSVVGNGATASETNKWFLVNLNAGDAANNIPQSGQSSITATFTIPSNGQYYILAEDYVGNRTYADVTLDGNPPTGFIRVKNAISLSNGNLAVGNANVVLLIRAEDESGVDAIIVRNEENKNDPITESDWISWDSAILTETSDPNEKEMPWRLPNPDGNKTVYLWIRDIYGNIASDV